jgi:VIT1/CCC1 family predicted Fe2+/Mn2+ transporter
MGVKGDFPKSDIFCLLDFWGCIIGSLFGVLLVLFFGNEFFLLISSSLMTLLLLLLKGWSSINEIGFKTEWLLGWGIWLIKFEFSFFSNHDK